MRDHDKKISAKTFKRKPLKVYNRREQIIPIILENPKKATGAAIVRKLREIGVEVSEATVCRDLKDPEFEAEVMKALHEQYDMPMKVKAVRNINKSLDKGNTEDSKWVLKESDYFGSEQRAGDYFKGFMESLALNLAKLQVEQKLNVSSNDQIPDTIEYEIEPPPTVEG